MHQPRGARARTILLAAVMLAAALAGCASDDAPPGAGNEAAPGPGEGDGAGGDGDATGGDDGEPGPAPAVEPVGPSYQRTLYLTADGGLQAAGPEQGSVPLQGGWHQLATGLEVTTFASQQLLAPVIVQAEPITLSIWLEADAPMASSGEFDLVGWVGSTRGINLFSVTSWGQPVLAPGEPTLVELQLNFDGTRPLYVPAGEQLVVHLISGSTDEGSGLLNVLTGGETSSSLNLTLAQVNVDPLAEVGQVQTETLEGTLAANSQPFNCNVAEDITTQHHTITVDPETTYLELSLEGAPGAGHRDLDMVLLDGGQRVMGTGSPYTQENILLVGPTLDGLPGKDLTVQVYACSAANTSYTVTVQQG